MIRLAKLAVIFLMLTIPTLSFAWEQMYTCDTDTCNGYPRKKVSWPSSNVKFYVNQEGTYQMELYDIISITMVSLEEWTRPEISSLRPSYEGFTTQTKGYDLKARENQNVIVFCDETWRDSRSILALTTVTRNNVNGDILDADIEINSVNHTFGICKGGEKTLFDFQNTLTHELGHAFGLNHSNVEGATMSPFTPEGDISLRTLGDDELEALAVIYPPKDDSSCSAQPLKSTGFGSLLWIGLAFCAAAGISYRKRKDHST